jgi:hypothetical protein
VYKSLTQRTLILRHQGGPPAAMHYIGLDVQKRTISGDPARLLSHATVIFSSLTINQVLLRCSPQRPP